MTTLSVFVSTSFIYDFLSVSAKCLRVFLPVDVYVDLYSLALEINMALAINPYWVYTNHFTAELKGASELCPQI